MSLTLRLLNVMTLPPEIERVVIPEDMFNHLAIALRNTQCSDTRDLDAPGTDMPEDLYLGDMQIYEVENALLHLKGYGSRHSDEIATRLAPILHYAQQAQIKISVLRTPRYGDKGAYPAVLLDDAYDARSPKQWTFVRAQTALALADIILESDAPLDLAARTLIDAKERIKQAQIFTRASIDLENLGKFAEQVLEYNDDPTIRFQIEETAAQ